jgi:hypothetical protein
MYEVNATTRLKLTAASGDDWWNSLSRKQQKEYIKLHPKSKYAKGAGKGSSTKPAKPVAPSKPTEPSKSATPDFSSAKNIQNSGLDPKNLTYPQKAVIKDLKGVTSIKDVISKVKEGNYQSSEYFSAAGRLSGSQVSEEARSKFKDAAKKARDAHYAIEDASSDEEAARLKQVFKAAKAEVHKSLAEALGVSEDELPKVGMLPFAEGILKSKPVSDEELSKKRDEREQRKRSQKEFENWDTNRVRSEDS